jgi:hypothetical protein
MKLDVLNGRTDCTVIERADAPTANQVAVVWVSEDGIAPEVRGLILIKFNKIQLIKYFC